MKREQGNRYHYKSPIGTICIEEQNGAVTGLYIEEDYEKEKDCEVDLLKETNRQLAEYFEGKRTVFDVPVALKGTVFQQKVWKALQEIPYGETRSYGELARAIGSPKASRAVGGANHNNPVMIIVPCHRVIGANGRLVGFGGGLEAKAYLLKLEREAAKPFKRAGSSKA